ncbi:MAG TPA: LacI family DNA-binding transcriptional regulator, partial [Armatimonadota bacterium]
MSLTMDELAQMLGVSKTTVHFALSGKGKVSAQTRERVKQKAAELGYQPNILARSLRMKSTSIIGVVMHTNFDDPIYGKFVATIDTLAQAQGYLTMHASGHHHPEKEQRAYEHFCGSGAEALIIQPEPTADPRRYHALARQAMPIMTVLNQVEGLPFDMVGIDDFATGYLAAQHLLSCGCRSIAFLGMALIDNSNWVRERLRGCDQAAREAGLPSIPVLHVPLVREEQSVLIAAAAGVVQTALQHGLRCDGLVAANDMLAYSALQGIEQAGLRVPNDISVIGVDDAPFSSFCTPTLTTFIRPMVEIAEVTMDILFRRLQGATRET